MFLTTEGISEQICIRGNRRIYLASGLSGCVTITEGKTDSIALTSVPVDGAKCSMKNGVGEWFITTPGSAEVHKSQTDLAIDCPKDGYQPVHATMSSHLRA